MSVEVEDSQNIPPHFFDECLTQDSCVLKMSQEEPVFSFN